MAYAPNRNGTEFHRVVLSACLRGIEQKTQNLRIRLCGRAHEAVKQREHKKPTDEGVQEIEDYRSHHHREEKELPLRTHEGEGSVKRAVHGIESAIHHERDRASPRNRFFVMGRAKT